MIILTQNLKDISLKGLVDIQCEYCKNIYQLTKKSVKAKKKYEKAGYCSKRCRNIANGKLILCKCSQCNSLLERCRKEYIKSTAHFCSNSCSAKFYNPKKDWAQIWTSEKREKISKWAKIHAHKISLEEIRRNPKFKDLKLCERVCPICFSNFVAKHASHKQKYCSKECCSKRPNQGGFRENSTRLHRCIYNGIKMDSGSEKKFAEILDKNNIRWSKNSTKYYSYEFEGKNKKYYPDFYLPDLKLWVEIKGKIYVELWLPNKLQSVKDAGENIVMIFSKEIKEDFVLNLIKR
jgi:hypothetical protein